MSEIPRTIHVGSRKSELALIQTRYVIAQLKSRHPDKEFEIVTMNTLGDKILDVPLPKIGEKSLFTQELETALSEGSVDFVVHSLKDLPTTLPPGMAIGAVLKREDPRDALVLRKDITGKDLHSLPEGSVIGTSSLRRTAQLSKKFPHLKVEDIRGNLNTRLRKLDELGKFSAILLASAGLERMGWKRRISNVLDDSDFLYAVGQGALAVECRKNDAEIIEMLSPLYDYETGIRVIAERRFLCTLEGGCSAPVAISTEIRHIDGSTHRLSMTGAVWSLDGTEEVKDSVECVLDLKTSSVCPYKDKCNNICVQYADGKESKTDEYEKPPKKQKVEQNQTEIAKTDSRTEDIPLDLLRNDAHDSCPIVIPVGADFMGKCPYLEASTDGHHDSAQLAFNSSDKVDLSKCPFFSNKTKSVNAQTSNAIDEQNCNVSEICKQTNVYCGLVPHKSISDDILNQADHLGDELAKKLIERGALKVMQKAKAHIRSA